MLDISNARYNADGTIDCDWNHPVHGVIPFRASPNDVEPHGRAIFEAAESGEFGEIEPYQEPTE